MASSARGPRSAIRQATQAPDRSELHRRCTVSRRDCGNSQDVPRCWSGIPVGTAETPNSEKKQTAHQERYRRQRGESKGIELRAVRVKPVRTSGRILHTIQPGTKPDHPVEYLQQTARNSNNPWPETGARTPGLGRNLLASPNAKTLPAGSPQKTGKVTLRRVLNALQSRDEQALLQAAPHGHRAG